MSKSQIEIEPVSYSSKTDPVERFFERRSAGEVALIAILVGLMLFVAGILIGGAIGDFGI